MINVWGNLYIGGKKACFHNEPPGWAVIHACKNPCHAMAVGYTGSLASSHPNYLQLRRGSHLYLNLIDPPTPLFMPESFKYALDFIDEYIGSRKVLIHCNQAFSRAPSIALLYLAKRAEAIRDTSYAAAFEDFLRLCPGYMPGEGIRTFFTENWESLL